ncbi:hypothetical protein K1T71_009422 [Dendrolimus kikuchii]|uniref:Uncharacterized protein n=1 Tax=Dendrolimus kikuchii TaxID=765133 RepID=A0ACC1CUN3_9NEOP|nr:hypothetical protein K1T71_009422 [Dendrolimus kikuchii]
MDLVVHSEPKQLQHNGLQKRSYTFCPSLYYPGGILKFSTFTHVTISETIPEIAYELQNQGEIWSLLPVNAIDNIQFGEAFIVIEEQPVIISIYNTNFTGNENYTFWIYYLDTWLRKQIIEEAFRFVSGFPSKYYIQIDRISRFMVSKWLMFLDGHNMHVCTSVTFHLRPSKDISSIMLRNMSLSTHTANYTIKDFDAFACLVYNENQLSELTCKSSRDTVESVKWINNESPDFTLFDKREVHFEKELKAKHDGTYFDCVETYLRKGNPPLYKDYIIVRIFLISNGSVKNNINVKPKSNNDHEGCLQYVHDLYGTNDKNQTDNLNWKSGVIIFVVVISLLANAILILKYFIYKKKKNAKTTGLISKNESNEVVRDHRRSNISSHLYCYIDESSILSLQNQRPGPQSSDHGNVDNVNRPNKKPIKFSCPRHNSAEVVAEPNDSAETNDELYSDVYANRFDILSVLKSQM